MNLDEFLWHAKRGHGECIIVMKQENILNYKKIIKKIFLNNYAFLNDDEYRSSYSCELVNFYNDDKYFLNLLWDKIRRTKLENYYSFNYLINNLYFVLARNKDIPYTKKINNLLIKNLNKHFFTLKESKSICSLISLIMDLNINISIKEIINQHYTKFKNSNLDLSDIEYYYQINLTNKKRNLVNEKKFKNFNLFLKCISNNNIFYKQFPFIAKNINNTYYENLLDLLDDDIDNSLRTNILKIILYSNKKDIETIDKLIKTMNKLTIEQKNIIYEILTKIKSKKILTMLYQSNLENSFIIGLILNNYNKEKYGEVHKRILKIKINYSNSNNWFEIEDDIIKYFNKKIIDKRLLVDLKFFLKNGLSSTSRYKIALILKKYNMLNDDEIKSLKYDANYKIRKKFNNF